MQIKRKLVQGLFDDLLELMMGESCDHDVGICYCSILEHIDAAQRALADEPEPLRRGQPAPRRSDADAVMDPLIEQLARETRPLPRGVTFVAGRTLQACEICDNPVDSAGWPFTATRCGDHLTTPYPMHLDLHDYLDQRWAAAVTYQWYHNHMRFWIMDVGDELYDDGVTSGLLEDDIVGYFSETGTPCGCPIDYHLADCPLRTGEGASDYERDPYGDDRPLRTDDYDDDETVW
jgi:hypothetical protein